MIEEGYVHDVRLVTLGTFLDGDHLTGATTLNVMDAADFNEEGGSIILDGLTLDYVSADLEADTITLASALTADYEDGVPLSISPLTYEKQALVVLDDFDEALTVTVPHSLHDRLAEGMREDFNRESVTVELRNGTWYLDNVYGIEPVIDGQYLQNVVADDVIDGIVTTLKLADDAVTQAKIAAGAVGNNELINAAVDAAKIAADAVTNAAIADGAVNPSNLSVALGTTVMQRWTDVFDDPDTWTVTTATGASWNYVTTSDAQSGGSVGQANGYVTLTGKNLIAYDPNTIYRVSMRVRTTVEPSSGPDTLYLGVTGYAADKVTYVNRDGSNSSTSMFYPAALNQSLPSASGWVTYTGYLKGRSAPGVTAPGGPANDIQNPFTVHDLVRYITPRLLFNYTTRDNASIMQVDSVTIEALRTGVVTANELAANSVTAGKILAGAVGADQLAANAVTAGKIAAGAIQAGTIAAGAIATDDIAANAITGAKIAGLTITGDKIAANTITASNLVAGTITADKLDTNALIGKTAQSANFVNDPEQGITGWQFNADGSAYLRTATIGNDLYAINETGNAKFQSVSASSLYLDGEDFEALVNNQPYGVLNVYPMSGAYTYAAANTEYYITRFTIPNVQSRMYRITLDNFRFDRGDNTSGQTAPTQFQVNCYSNYDAAATNADYCLHQFWRGAGYTQSASDDLWTSSHTFSPADANVGKDLSIAIYSSANGINSGPRLEMTGNSRIVVEDVGGKVVYAPTVDITNPVAAKSTYTKTYSATWMGSWGSANGKRTDSNAYQGRYSGTWGNNYSKYGFSSAIQTDLTGATVKKVELYLDNTHFYSNSGGSAIVGTHANSTEPTGSSSTSGTFDRQRFSYTYGQAKWVTLSSSFGTDLKSGAALGITLGGPAISELSNYGYFTSGAKLRITYEK